MEIKEQEFSMLSFFEMFQIMEHEKELKLIRETSEEEFMKMLGGEDPSSGLSPEELVGKQQTTRIDPKRGDLGKSQRPRTAPSKASQQAGVTSSADEIGITTKEDKKEWKQKAEELMQAVLDKKMSWADAQIQMKHHIGEGRRAKSGKQYSAGGIQQKATDLLRRAEAKLTGVKTTRGSTWQGDAASQWLASQEDVPRDIKEKTPEGMKDHEALEEFANPRSKKWNGNKILQKYGLTLQDAQSFLVSLREQYHSLPNALRKRKTYSKDQLFDAIQRISRQNPSKIQKLIDLFINDIPWQKLGAAPPLGIAPSREGSPNKRYAIYPDVQKVGAGAAASTKDEADPNIILNRREGEGVKKPRTSTGLSGKFVGDQTPEQIETERVVSEKMQALKHAIKRIDDFKTRFQEIKQERQKNLEQIEFLKNRLKLVKDGKIPYKDERGREMEMPEGKISAISRRIEEELHRIKTEIENSPDLQEELENMSMTAMNAAQELQDLGPEANINVDDIIEKTKRAIDAAKKATIETKTSSATQVEPFGDFEKKEPTASKSSKFNDEDVEDFGDFMKRMRRFMKRTA